MPGGTSATASPNVQASGSGQFVRASQLVSAQTWEEIIARPATYDSHYVGSHPGGDEITVANLHQRLSHMEVAMKEVTEGEKVSALRRQLYLANQEIARLRQLK